MEDRESKIIEDYVTKMLEVQKERYEQPLSLEELKEIAISVGMTERDWLASQEALEQHLKNGIEHIKNKNWKDAVDELKQAVAINPYHEEGLFHLAKSYHELYRKTGNATYRDEAKSLSDRVLRNENKNLDSAAIALLNDIRNTETDLKDKRNSLLRIIGLSLISAVVLTMIVLYSFSLSVSSRQKELEQKLVKVEQTWGQVENVYQRRETLIPQVVNLAKSASKYDASKLEELQRMRQGLNPSNRDEYRQKQDEITKALTEMMGNMEGNAQTLRDIQVQVEGSENRIRVEWKKYNDAVAVYNSSVISYNDAIKSFPLSLLGYKSKEKLKVEIKK